MIDVVLQSIADQLLLSSSQGYACAAAQVVGTCKQGKHSTGLTGCRLLGLASMPGATHYVVIYRHFDPAGAPDLLQLRLLKCMQDVLGTGLSSHKH